MGVVRRFSVVALVSAALLAAFSVAAVANEIGVRQGDCKADLDPRSEHWTVKCKAPHRVTVRIQEWQNLPDKSSPTYNSWYMGQLVGPGEPWSLTINHIIAPDKVCLTAYQDGKRIEGPRCSSAHGNRL